MRTFLQVLDARRELRRRPNVAYVRSRWERLERELSEAITEYDDARITMHLALSDFRYWVTENGGYFRDGPFPVIEDYDEPSRP